MKKLNLPNSRLVLFLAFIFVLHSCKEPKEGCMDINASNWDAEADKPCDDCCSYPLLQFSFTHLFADTLFDYGDPFTDDFGNVYSILSIRYYLSDIFIKTNDDIYHVSDSIQIVLLDNTQRDTTFVRDDVLFITKGVGTATVGTFQKSNLFFDSLFFTIGLPEPYNRIDPASVPATHPLAPKADSMYWTPSEGYIFQRIVLLPDTSNVADTFLVEIGGEEALVNLALELGQSGLPGINLTIPLEVDYKKYFAGINFANHNPTEIKHIIVSNMANCFSVR